MSILKKLVEATRPLRDLTVFMKALRNSLRQMGHWKPQDIQLSSSLR